MRNHIGGRMDCTALAALTQPERLHRPDDQATLAREARSMADRGLTVRDIAQALNLATAAVEALINPKENRHG